MLAALALSASLALAACNDHECEPGQGECSGGVAKNCEEGETGLGQVERWDEQHCRGADYCRMDENGRAFCTAEPGRNQACVEGEVCDGNVLLTCHAGYVVSSTLCATCNAASKDCRGAVDSLCEQDSDCAAGLACAISPTSHLPICTAR